MGPGYRDEVWSRLDQKWDLIVVGGGITGAEILSEASRLGKNALLVEAQDFASGTSSRTTKLVHGGLRYLRQGQFIVTRESVTERERLMVEGKGLINPLAFSLAAFPGESMPTWMYGIGLAIYDALAWKWAHQAQSRSDLIAKIPALSGSKVRGGYRYFDAQTDDARLVFRVLKEGVRHGGTAINYARAETLLRTQNGRVRGIVLHDVAPGPSRTMRTIEIEAKIVINATGAWTDELRTQLGHKKRLRQIRGSHIAFHHSRFPLKEAVGLVHPRDQRAVFAIPWEGVTIFGSTDVDHGALDGEPSISQNEIEYFFEVLNTAFPSLELTPKDVLSTWSGVRPVVNTGKRDPSKESRDYAIWKDDGLLTVTGGKLTTFVIMARDALRAVEGDLGKIGSRTRIFDEVPTEIAWPEAMDEPSRTRLFGRYGAEVSAIAADVAGAKRIGDSIAYCSELRHAARHEAVVTLSDLLLRRVRLGLLLPNGGMNHIAEIRAIAQPELGWDDARWEREETEYRATYQRSYSLPPSI
ncbi:MAG: glycerol-3-phosphate dehydrogenase/oxidase [Polyangiaceae bacterium]|nr:glycerol-3-phosphate dehydrogenase/oxidase [Polyangiaceae bacterium]